MIKELQIINKENGYTLTFLIQPEFARRFGVHNTYCDDRVQKIAEEKNTYMLYNFFPQGYYSLPANNNISMRGYNQDGIDLQSNYYSPRQMLFNFKQFWGTNISHQNRTLIQYDTPLTHKIVTDNGEYFIDVTLIGNVENGAVELQSVGSPYFKLPNDIVKSFTIRQSETSNALIPSSGFKVNKVYFYTNSKDVVIDVDFKLQPEITIFGVFDDVTITNNSNQKKFVFTGRVNESLYINTADDSRVMVDGNPSFSFTGTLPDMEVGTNHYEIDFRNKFTDIQVVVSYKGVVASVV